jgi:transcriptional regulator with XRE-family HTH domain
MSWSTEDIIEIRNQLEMTQAQLAKLLGVDTRSVTRWESGASRPTGSAEAILNGLREKLSKDPDTLDSILSVIGGAVAVGGLAYLIVKLLDALTDRD